MKRSDFHFELPAELIAQHPTASRSGSRLLVFGGGRPAQRSPIRLPQQLRDGDAVFNNTRVVKARLYGIKGRDRWTR